MSTLWEPARTWAFVVGVLDWKHDDIYSSFPQEERRDAQLVELFAQRGIPKQQIVYLQDRKATTKAIETALVTHLKAAPEGATFIFYYTGHGWKRDDGEVFFASYDADNDGNEGYAISTLIDRIEAHFRGTHAILIADCCHSGHLVDAINARSRRVAYAGLGSSLSSELSTGNWTFTEAIIAALRGDAYTDRDGNATITLAELAEHIRDEMAFAEEQVATFGVSRGFDPDFVLASAHPRRHQELGRNVAVFAEDRWWAAQIIDLRGKEFKVRYYGYTSEFDQWVSAEQIRNLGRPRYPIGATVEVQRKQRWYTATILDERAGIHYVTYEDKNAEWNEWIGSRRIRPLL